MRSVRIWTCLAPAFISVVATAALAQGAYPSRTIHIVVPTPAGSAIDLLARIYSKGLQEKWGQPVVTENRVGASHNIGADAVARAEPDGYTLLTAPPPALSINQYLFPKLGFDPLAFAPVTVITDVPNVLLVRPSLGVADTAGLIALAKQKPGRINYASAGNGSTPHLSGEAFKAKAGIDLLRVPYASVPQIISEMLAGRVDVAFVNLVDAYAYVADGSLLALAVGTAARSPELPNVPCVSDVLPGYVSTAWFAVVAPPKTPAALTEKLSVAIRESFQRPDATQLLRNLHATPLLNAPAEAAAFIKADSLRWKEVIEANNIRGE